MYMKICGQGAYMGSRATGWAALSVLYVHTCTDIKYPYMYLHILYNYSQLLTMRGEHRRRVKFKLRKQKC